MAAHETVLLEEAVRWLSPAPGGTVVDGTLGGGGHAERLLDVLGREGRLIALDKDPRAIQEAKKRLGRFGTGVIFIQADFKNISGELKRLGIGKVQGVLLDLGVSAFQLEDAQRGFSFRSDGPLDMRMDPREALTAADRVNDSSEEELLSILWKWGQEPYARRIVAGILRERSRRRIETTGELARIIWEAVPRAYRHGRIHPATRSFQALRMAVNHEVESLEEFLAGAPELLSEGARLVAVAFHSGEDRLVKQAFVRYRKQGLGEVLTKKPVRPTPEEIHRNARSRSAKLRAFEKRTTQAA